MKLQHLIVIFLVIMIPMVLIMSQYTSLQIDTLAEKTKYDTALLGATYDTMAAFELNTRNSESSSVIGEEIRDLEAIISTFTNSLSSSLGVTGVGNDYIMSYVPAMVFSLYDGYYIYSRNSITGEQELKPYVYYTKTYTNGVGTNITISYSLDNYVTIYGTYGGKEISAAGYLVVPEDIEVSADFTYATTTKKDGSLENYVVRPGEISWIKYKGIDIEKEIIYENETVAETRGVVTDESEDTTEAMLYYYEAKVFTELYNSVIGGLSLPDQNILKITPTNDPEDENSAFMNEKIDVIKSSITKNLNTAIYNYDGAIAENYEMPQLNGEDWDKILDDISIIAFLKNIPIGTTNYNNYVVVNSTTNQKYVSAKSIDFIAYDKTTSKSLGYYHNITCDTLINNIEDGHRVVGYAELDFERYRYSPNNSNEYYYYYKHNEYADYDCEVKVLKPEGVATIEDALSSKIGLSNETKDKVLKTYYTAVGRIRYRLVKASSYINVTDKTKTFGVVYHTNGGNWAGSPATQRTVDSEYGKIRVNQETPQKLGYIFLGWSMDPNATLPDIKTGDVLYLNRHTRHNLYAVYAQQFTITYNLNGGTGGPTPLQQTKTKDVDFIISKAQPIMDNKMFLGWSTDQNAAIPDSALYPGAIYTGNQDLTLYAIWTDQVVEIQYYSAGETYTDFKAIGASKTVWQPTARDGYEFKGWATSAGTRDVQYALGEQYTGNTDIKLYAVWDIITYRITFDANGGNPLEGDLIDPTKRTKTYGFTYIIPNIYPNRELFTFKGWSTDRHSTVGEYQPGGNYDKNENIILYAIWEGETYTIEYDANGGSNAPAKSDPILKTDEVHLTTEKPIRTGYEFIGWSTDQYAGEEDIEYKSGDAYTGRTSIKLYAIWKRATYRVIYMVDGAEFASQDKTYRESIDIISQEPTKEGYNFTGWSENEGGTVGYLAGQKFNNDLLVQNGIITLYAVWDTDDENLYILEYSANGGEGAPEEETREYSSTLALSSTIPTRTGYTFTGWSTSNIETTETYAAGENFTMPAQDVTLYAVWSINSYSFNYNSNTTDASITNMPSSTTYQYDSDVTINSKRPTRTNYYFTKWTTNANGEGNAYQPGTSFGKMPAYNINLYAQWKKKTKVMILVFGDTVDIAGNSSKYDMAKSTINSILNYEKTYPLGDSTVEERSAYAIDVITNPYWIESLITNNQSKYDLIVLLSYGSEYPSDVMPTQPYLLYENIEYIDSAQEPIINDVKAKIDELMGT